VVKQRWIVFILLVLILTACAGQSPESAPATTPPTTRNDSPTARPSATPSATDTATGTATYTSTPSSTPSLTLTPTYTPTPSLTPLPSATPTPEQAIITASGSVNCRYGPDPDYLYAWGLSEGETADLDGRNYNKTWLWVRPHDVNWHCWVTADAVVASVELDTIPVVYPTLLTNPSVPPPGSVNAARNGSRVTISWNPAPPSVDLAYLIEARICIGGFLFDVVESTTNTSLSLTDETGCSGDSYGQVRVVNKLGYSTAQPIAWP
jgi:hypothetical protein